MNKYIFTNSNMLLDNIRTYMNISKKQKKQNNCPICKKKFDNVYYFKNSNIKEHVYHLLEEHNIIDENIYKILNMGKICDAVNKSSNISWCLFSTNSLNIIDGLYEIGSNQIYSEKKKTIRQSNIIRYSEHAGYLYIAGDKINKITIFNGYRTESSDPFIYMPTNTIEAFTVNYLFHTHPKTPYIGSRIKNGIIYEFPSISDILHFIEHHNRGKLLGSIVLAPEGIYIIRKNKFDRNKIKIDYDIFVDEIDEIYTECYNDSLGDYSHIEINKFIKNNEIELPNDIFYKQIAPNFKYLKKINTKLLKYDLYIDYYPRILLNNSENFTHHWLFPDIYIPIIS
jgi:hypothetical protein